MQVMTKKAILLCGVVFFLAAVGYAKPRPLTVRMDDIPNRVYLRYAEYIGDELVGFWHIVYMRETTNGTNFLRIYTHVYWYAPGFETPRRYAFIPLNMEDFATVTLIDLDRLRLIKFEDQYPSTERRRGITWETSKKEFLDVTNSVFRGELTRWEGYEYYVRRGSIKVDLSLPLFNSAMTFVLFPIGALDFEGGGEAQVASTRMFGAAPRGTFRITRTEKVETPLGIFDTVKLDVWPNDFSLRFFLGRHLDNFGALWVDKESRRTVKRRWGAHSIYILETYEEFTDWPTLAERVNQWVENEGLPRLAEHQADR